jgi:hypothetical protein
MNIAQNCDISVYAVLLVTFWRILISQKQKYRYDTAVLPTIVFLRQWFVLMVFIYCVQA